jgi:hypothetical protein
MYDYGTTCGVNALVKAFHLKCHEAIDYPQYQAEWREYLKREAEQGSVDEDIYFEETRDYLYQSGRLQR